MAVRLPAAARLLVQQLCGLVEQVLRLVLQGRGLRGVRCMLLGLLQSTITAQVVGPETAAWRRNTLEMIPVVTCTNTAAQSRRYHSRGHLMIRRDSLVSLQSPLPRQRAPQDPHGCPSFASAFL